MPSIAAHMVVSKLVSEKLNIKDPDFIKGNLLPDIILKSNSHYTIKGTYYFVPDLEYFRNNFDLTNNIFLGYYVHLLLDYYFLETFVPKNISDFGVFESGRIYKEYDMINYQLVKEFNLDVETIKEILSDFKEEIDKEKLAYNLECLSRSIIKETRYLKFSNFSKFLIKISEVISEEIQKYANKPNRMFFCPK